LPEDADLLVTLAATLAAASAGALLAAFLRQSVVLGYVVAGLFIGPHTPGFVADAPSVEQLADIGIILLMFAIGLQVSLAEMLRVGRVAALGGTIQVAATIGIGYAAGVFLGWPPLEALFFGAVISNSSSTVLTKVLDERGETESTHGRISLAWSSVQDLGTVGLIVVLTSLAGDRSGGVGAELAVEIGRAAIYLLIVAPISFIVLPRLFELVARLGNREVFVLTAVGVALGMAYASALFGISIALGAFIAGIVVGRSDISHQVLGEITPMRDIFAGLFFVSVGMLVDPRLLAENWPLIILGVALIVGVKALLSAGITLAFGYRGKTAVLTGLILGQSAEFSFLLARLGLELEAVSDEVFGVLLGSAVISVMVVPFTYRGGQPAGALLDRALPSPRVSDYPPVGRMEGHAIICGYGRVGQIIASVLEQMRIPYVVIEQDVHTISGLRDRGVPTVMGSSSNTAVLDQAGIASASLLVIAIPDPISARRIVDYGRSISSELDIVVRAHSEPERLAAESRGANEAVVGELELALEMSRHSLRLFGVSGEAIEEAVDAIRFGSSGRKSGQARPENGNDVAEEAR
jgi:monovalent cation:H+ antiporter-2, CPA2 family